jgi:hypothetical protein
MNHEAGDDRGILANFGESTVRVVKNATFFETL